MVDLGWEMVFIVQSFFHSLRRVVLAGEYLWTDEESSPHSCWSFNTEDNESLAAAEGRQAAEGNQRSYHPSKWDLMCEG